MFKHLVAGALCAGLMASGGTVPEAQQPEQQSPFGREVVSVAAIMANNAGACKLHPQECTWYPDASKPGGGICVCDN
jgi:hypothetical protein